MADRWLDLAPKPGPLPAGKQWHVFLSYRSVNRPWVLALYDILNVLGYKIFLDQYCSQRLLRSRLRSGRHWTRVRAQS